MIDALLQAIESIYEYYLDGFLAMVAIAIVAPLLGVLLVLRRMPLLGLAVPQMAGCGQAATFFFFALTVTIEPGEHLHEPSRWLQLAGSLLGVALGLLALVVLTKDRRFLGVYAGIVFLTAIALRELFFLESPFHQAAEQSIHHGRLLTVGSEGRNQVLACTAVVFALTCLMWRRMWLTAFDTDQARLIGLSDRKNLAATLLLLGALSALCVPIVGPEVVLSLMIIPPAILRPVTPSLRAFAPLSITASVLGSVTAFVLACTEIDWPPGPALVLCVVGASLVVAGVAKVIPTGRA